MPQGGSRGCSGAPRTTRASSASHHSSVWPNHPLSSGRITRRIVAELSAGMLQVIRRHEFGLVTGSSSLACHSGGNRIQQIRSCATRRSRDRPDRSTRTIGARAGSPRSRPPDELLPVAGARNVRADRGAGRMHHLSHPVVHHFREPAGSERHGDGFGSRAGGHLSRGRVRVAGDGAVRQLPDRAGARDGTQRLLRGNCRRHAGTALAGRPGRGVLLRRAHAGPFRASRAGMGGEQHSALAEGGHCGGDRVLPGDHRASQRRRHRRERSHTGRTGEPRPVAGDPGDAGGSSASWRSSNARCRVRCSSAS